MRYDQFDYGISLDAPLTHRKYKCKICKEYFNPSFVLNGLWCGYWRCDHIKFCYDHTGEQIESWIRGHLKSTDDTDIDIILRIYLEQQKVIDAENELNRILVSSVDYSLTKKGLLATN